MTTQINDEMMEAISALAKLELTDREKAQAKKDMRQMLTFVECLNRLDTANTEPAVPFYAAVNALREDEVRNGDGRQQTLQNAPDAAEGMFVVPKTV